MSRSVDDFFSLTNRFAKNANHINCVNERSCDIFLELLRLALEPSTYCRNFVSYTMLLTDLFGTEKEGNVPFSYLQAQYRTGQQVEDILNKDLLSFFPSQLILFLTYTKLIFVTKTVVLVLILVQFQVCLQRFLFLLFYMEF